jgi:hypothetical protein
MIPAVDLMSSMMIEQEQSLKKLVLSLFLPAQKQLL